MTLTKQERETIVNFNEADRDANIYTYNGPFTRKLAQLAEQFPEDVKLVRADQHGGVTYTIPKKWIKIRAPRVLSEAEQAHCREALKKANLAQKSTR